VKDSECIFQHFGSYLSKTDRRFVEILSEMYAYLWTRNPWVPYPDSGFEPDPPWRRSALSGYSLPFRLDCLINAPLCNPPLFLYIVYFAQSAAKTEIVYKTQKIDTQTKEKTYENIKTLGNM